MPRVVASAMSGVPYGQRELARFFDLLDGIDVDPDSCRHRRS
jgi:hypothetical protein